MMYNREGGYWEKVRSYYLAGNSPAPPPAHRVHGITTNAVGGLINLTLCYFQPVGVVRWRRRRVLVKVTWPVSKRVFLFNEGHLTSTGAPSSGAPLPRAENNKWVKLVSPSSILVVLPCSRWAGGGAGLFPGRQ